MSDVQWASTGSSDTETQIIDPTTFNIELEQAILGAVFLDNRLASRVSYLRPEHFWESLHAEIYEEIVAAVQAGRPATPVTLATRFAAHPVIKEGLSVAQYLGKLAIAATTTRYLSSYAELLVELWHRRRTIDALREAANELGSPSSSVPAIIVRLTSTLQQVHCVQPSTGLAALSLSEFLNVKPPPRDWIITNLVRAGDLNMVFAPRGMGKTWLTQQMALSMASGRSFLKWQVPRAHKVVIVDGEMHVGSLQERLCALAGLERPDPESCDSTVLEQKLAEIGVCHSNLRILSAMLEDAGIPDLSTPEGQAMVEAALGDAEVVILDNVATLIRSGRENETESWRCFQDWLIRLRKQGRTVIIVHHAGKNGEQRGTSAREDVLDLVLLLEAPTDGDPSEGAQFDIIFKKHRGLTGADIEKTTVQLQVRNGKAEWAIGPKVDPRLEDVLRLHEQQKSYRQIEEETGVPKSTVSRMLKAHALSDVSRVPGSMGRDTGTATFPANGRSPS